MRSDIDEVDISQMDAVFEERQKDNGSSLGEATVAKLKEEVRGSYGAVKKILSDRTGRRSTYRSLYYAEYPMGAEHSKSVWLEQGGCFLFQIDAAPLLA